MKSIYRKIKTLIRVVLGQEVYYKAQKNVPVKWFGNGNAGFFVYERSISKDSIIYSFGVGEDISFDLELINKYQCNVIAFDPTPKSIKYISEQKTPNKYTFHDYGIFKHDGFITFFLPKNEDHVSGAFFNRWDYDEEEKKPIEVPVKTFKTILNELRHNKIDILKMDIEGTEYEIIDDVLNAPIEIPQILIEVHHRFSHIHLSKTKELVEKLRAAGYKIVAVSDVREEYTFLKQEN